MIFQNSVNLFVTNEKIMNFFGTWPKSTKSLWTRKNRIHLTVILVLLIIPLVSVLILRFKVAIFDWVSSQIFHALLKPNGSLFELSSCLSVLFSVTLGTTKLTILFVYQNNIAAIIDDLNRLFRKIDRFDECKGTSKKVAATNNMIVKVFEAAAITLALFYVVLPIPYHIYKTWKSGVIDGLGFPMNL
jgi:hypothetical protein